MRVEFYGHCKPIIHSEMESRKPMLEEKWGWGKERTRQGKGGGISYTLIFSIHKG